MSLAKEKKISLQQLQKRCTELGLSPCIGKGITKAVLQRRIADHEAGIPATKDKVSKASNAAKQSKISKTPARAPALDLSPRVKQEQKAIVPPMKESSNISPRKSKADEMYVAETFSALYKTITDNLKANPHIANSNLWSNIKKELDARMINNRLRSPDSHIFRAIIDQNEDDVLNHTANDFRTFLGAYPTIIMALSPSTIISGIQVAAGDIDALTEENVENLIPYVRSYAAAVKAAELSPLSVEDLVIWVDTFKEEKNYNMALGYAFVLLTFPKLDPTLKDELIKMLISAGHQQGHDYAPPELILYPTIGVEQTLEYLGKYGNEDEILELITLGATKGINVISALINGAINPPLQISEDKIERLIGMVLKLGSARGTYRPSDRELNAAAALAESYEYDQVASTIRSYL